MSGVLGQMEGVPLSLCRRNFSCTADKGCPIPQTESSNFDLAYAMDDDLGSSVWATPASRLVSLSSPDYPTSPQPSFTVNPRFDDLDGFGTQKDESGLGDDDHGCDDDDDFGDFGEFGQVEGITEDFGSSGQFSDSAAAVPVAGSSSWDWEPLRFDPHPSRQMLEAQIEEILGPLWNADDTSQALTDEDVREVGGLAQILVTPDR
jgi:hypothetical protein